MSPSCTSLAWLCLWWTADGRPSLLVVGNSLAQDHQAVSGFLATTPPAFFATPGSPWHACRRRRSLPSFGGVGGAAAPAPAPAPRRQGGLEEGHYNMLERKMEKEVGGEENVEQDGTLKNNLMRLGSTMTGTPDECLAMESYVDQLEESHVPIATMAFLNLAMQGEWRLLFSTNLLTQASDCLRVTDLTQRVDPDSVGGNGTITNVATWELAQDDAADDGKKDDGKNGKEFNVRGTLTCPIYYRVNPSSGQVVFERVGKRVLELAWGSQVPTNVSLLTNLLQQAIPYEWFHPEELAVDMTFCDSQIRIVRYTAPLPAETTQSPLAKLEGVRNIFVRHNNNNNKKK